MDMSRLNIHDNVKIVLTDKGAELLTRFYNSQPVNRLYEDPKKREYKGSEEYENTLMEIMHIFGKYLYEDCTPLFENNLLFY